MQHTQNLMQFWLKLYLNKPIDNQGSVWRFSIFENEDGYVTIWETPSPLLPVSIGKADVYLKFNHSTNMLQFRYEGQRGHYSLATEPQSTFEQRLLELCNRPLVNPFNVLSQIIKSKQMVSTKIRTGRYLTNSVPSFPKKSIYHGTTEQEIFSNAASAQALAQKKFTELMGDIPYGILPREDAIQALDYLDAQQESQHGSQNFEQNSEIQSNGSQEMKQDAEETEIQSIKLDTENNDSIPV